MNDERLIFGKSNKKGIVGLEPKDGDECELFIQDEQGNITSEIVPHRYWILTKDKPHNTTVKRLSGDLHFKWGKQYTNKKQFLKERQLLKQFDCFSIFLEQEALQVKDGYCFYQGLQQRDVSILSFDLETTGLNPHDPDAKVLLISCSYRDKNTSSKYLLSFDEFESQGEMISSFCRLVRKLNPSILMGHNIISFDIPYLYTIAEKHGIPLSLGRDQSPVRIANYESNFRLDGTRDLQYKKIRVYGRELLDTYFLAIKYDVAHQLESYGLKPIIKQLKMESPNRIYYDASQIRTNYSIPEEWEKIKNYCRDDADDPIKIWDKMGPSFFYFAQNVPKPFTEFMLSATGAQLNSIMLRSYLQEGHSLPKADPSQKFQGAISFGRPGIWKNVVKVDVTSLYPSIIITHKIFHKEKDPNGNFLRMVTFFTKQRIENKKKAKETNPQYYDDLQSAQKIGINSAYGLLGTPGLNFNYLSGAEFVTKEGREILKKAIKWATGEDYIEPVEEEEVT
jgi:DNA polymerase elongation subunit (family B)